MQVFQFHIEHRGFVTFNFWDVSIGNDLYFHTTGEKPQRLFTRRQKPNDWLLSDYIDGMHELFSGLQVAEVAKVPYFTEGLQPGILKLKF